MLASDATPAASNAHRRRTAPGFGASRFHHHQHDDSWARRLQDAFKPGLQRSFPSKSAALTKVRHHLNTRG